MRFSRLFHPIRPDNVVAFRILFGSIMLWEVYRYFSYGWIHDYWIEPLVNFKYGGFFWIQPLAGDGMYYLFFVLGALSLFIIAGFLYRASTVLFFVLFTYTFLLEQGRYLNHFYLVILLSFLMMFIPAHRTFSVDVWLFPKLRRKWIPAWTLMLLQFQIGAVYFFGGIAKINADWLSGSPMDLWLPGTDFPLVGQYFDIPAVTLFISYAGLLLDLLALPLLMFRKTRPWMALALLFFHLSNDRLFSIGIFPWFMIGVLVIYLPSSWPRQFWAYLKEMNSVRLKLAVVITSLTGGFLALFFHQAFHLVPLLYGLLITPILFWDFHKNPADENMVQHENQPAHSNLVLAGLGVWVFLQIVIPLRHYVIPGNPSWTEEGHRFAWHMKLRSKSCEQDFFIADSKSFKKKPLDIDEGPLQSWQYNDMIGRPQLIAQYAKMLSTAFDGKPIYAEVRCSLNGGPWRPLIDPDVDLSNVSFHDWKRNDWIIAY
ncbi:HTTM domain-containing protein [Rhodohalobacter sp. 614A]|uniref:HTTM domain-containing protein n=1 Tax=Rhodohalobacter sp. 614A TaxID=2908649 RepID=UPI001F256FCC|nr:HTTM domain-containing protein [Rhodohalobacter sp. 614A]